VRSRLLGWCVSSLLSLFFAATAAATQDYLMWQLPTATISFPVYVYTGGSQVGYIPSSSLQVFVGSYVPGSTSGSYDLYYQDGEGNWHTCALVLASGGISSKTTTCPGAVINPPLSNNGAQSNVYTVAVGAVAWPQAAAAPANPIKANYSRRTISLVNHTKYPLIQVGESCSTSDQANCQTTPIIAAIGKDRPHVITAGVDGLISAAFYLSSYCTASSVAACGQPPTAASCASQPPANWVCTGGYFVGQQAYATKIETTILTVTGGVPSGASNIDVSAVDGYNAGVRIYPSSSTYCTFTVPPEGSGVLGAGYYSAANPLAQIVPRSGDSLAALCAKSSQLPGPPKKGQTAWPLAKTSSAGAFEGCVSPCTYADSNATAEAPLFCCSGSYSTAATCTMPAGQMGANTSTYNVNIVKSPQFRNVYGYAFGDAADDFGCPPEANFVVEFVSASRY